MSRVTAKTAVKEILKLRGRSQEKLAQECGMKSQANVTGILNRGASLRVDSLQKMVEAMGCEIVIRDKMGSKAEWIVREEADGVD